MRPRFFGTFSPARILTLSFIGLIGLGMILYSLPCCTTTAHSLVDLFFISTSVVTTTGLTLIPVHTFTPWGQIATLVLMQIGGLGLVTLTLFLLSLIFDLGIAAQVFSARILSLDSWKDIRTIIFFIIKFSLIVEIVGATGIFLSIYSSYTISYALFLSIFHSVAAYTAAGISLVPGGMSSQAYNWPFLLTIIFLMFAGEMGFTVWHEVWEYIKTDNKKRFHFSLHAKIVLWSFIVITISSIILYWMLERNNTLAGLSPFNQFLNSVFNVTAARGTGFTTVETGACQLATIFLILLLSFIGASPGSTGSGIKTTTVVVLLATLKAAISGRFATTIRGRTIAPEQVYQAFSIVGLSICWITVILFLMLITENESFLDILFEIVSAFGNCGLSTGLTPFLTSFGKICITLTMIVGRVGCLAIVLSLVRKRAKIEYSLPEERIMVG